MGKSYKNKLTQYELLKSDKDLEELLPETQLLSKKSFSYFLAKYKEAIIKPIQSAGGRGIIKVWIDRKKRYKVHIKEKKDKFNEKNSAYSFITKKIKEYSLKHPSPGYIIQQCIPLALVEGRPFDIRVIVQRKKGLDWKVMGKYARIAKKGIATTNLKTGGKPVSLSEAINLSNLKNLSGEMVSSQIDRLALMIAEVFSQVRAKEHIWGVDFGIDVKGKIWLIENNTRPRYKGFKKIDPLVYDKITSYIESNKNDL